MNSYKRIFGVVLSMALLASSGCAVDDSAEVADDVAADNVTANSAALAIEPGGDGDRYISEEDQGILLGGPRNNPRMEVQSFTDTLLRLDNQSRRNVLHWWSGMSPNEPIPAWPATRALPTTQPQWVSLMSSACQLGAAAVGVTSIKCAVLGSPFDCASAVIGVAMWIEKCTDGPYDVPGRPRHPWDDAGCIGHMC